MGLAAAEQWWERSQLRVLVLGSLSLQFFLLVAAALRRRRCMPWFRLLTWAAYLGSNAMAIYALATLFTRHKKQQPAGGTLSRSSAELEALWAPVLLFHLGGQDGITAYSIQDNELWRRHMFTAASQVAIAVYVFRKSWPQGGDVRVLAAAILLFFPGILKCLKKPWALCMSSTRSIAAAVGANSPNQTGISTCNVAAAAVGANNPNQTDTSTSSIAAAVGDNIPNQTDTSTSSITAAVGANIPKQTDTSTCSSIEDFVEKASVVYAANNTKQDVGNDNDDDHTRLEVIHHLFVDLPYPYSVRLDLLNHVLVLHKGARGAHLFVRSGLSRTFDRLYTAGYKGYLSALVQALLVLLLASSVVLVIVTTTSSRSRGAYAAHDAAVDLKLTYVLLFCTAGLEVVSAVTIVYFGMMAEPPWPDQVAQCNLIGYLVHNEAHRWVTRLASLLGCKAYLDWVWCTAPSRTIRPSSSSSSDDITDLIYTHIADQWKKPPDGDTSNTELYIKDTATYRRFCNSRGQWTLDKEEWGGPLALPSVERPFDESVMVWHLATDMCFFHSVGDEQRETEKRQCRAISNYMAYLLLINPEMLMPGARRRIFTVAYNQVRETIVQGESQDDKDDDEKEVPLPPGGSQDMARMLVQKVRTTKPTKDSSSQCLVRDAWALAEELMKQEDKTWRVISGVWLEMLCFSASRCRGYLHSKSLATGGEYLSFVWLLRAFMGMETLAHLMQATEEGDLGAAKPPPVVAGSERV